RRARAPHGRAILAVARRPSRVPGRYRRVQRLRGTRPRGPSQTPPRDATRGGALPVQGQVAARVGSVRRPGAAPPPVAPRPRPEPSWTRDRGAGHAGGCPTSTPRTPPRHPTPCVHAATAAARRAG